MTVQLKVNARRTAPALGPSVIEEQNPWDAGVDTLAFDGAATNVEVQLFNRTSEDCWAAEFGLSNPGVDAARQINDAIGSGHPRFKSKISNP